MCWFFPKLAERSPVLRPLGTALSDSAGLFAVSFVIAAGLSAFNAKYRRRLLDAQRSLESISVLSWQDFERLVGRVSS